MVVFDVPANGRPLVIGELSTASVPGLPDGLATDVDDGLWVAWYRGSAVVRIDVVGGAIDRFAVPTAKPLSVCFADDELYVVTRSEVESGETGALLCARSPVAGTRVDVAELEIGTTQTAVYPPSGHHRRRSYERGVVRAEEGYGAGDLGWVGDTVPWGR